MRCTKDRRNWHTITRFPLDDSNHEAVLEDRRSDNDRRLDDMGVDERQMLLSEMPSLFVTREK